MCSLLDGNKNINILIHIQGVFERKIFIFITPNDLKNEIIKPYFIYIIINLYLNILRER